MVEDKVAVDANAEPASESTTTIAFGQAEPGYDVFGGKVVDKASSQMDHRAAQEADQQEPKEVSVVHTAQESSAVSLESSVEASDSTSSLDLEVPSASSDTTSDSQVELEKTQGPPEEVDAEAERARKELFPEEG